MDFFWAILFSKKAKRSSELKIPLKNQTDKTEIQVKRLTTKRDMFNEIFPNSNHYVFDLRNIFLENGVY